MKWLDGETREGMLKLVIVLAAFSLFTLSPVEAMAEGLEDVERATQTARTNFVKRFSDFTQDKNFLGRSQDPEGKEVPGTGAKTRFNIDDDNPFRSDLTYHDFAYDVRDEAFEKAQEQNKDPKAKKQRTLFAGISPHGSISGAGGSSLLERTVYAEHEKFSKEETDEEKKKREEEQGIKNVSIFRVETKDIKKNEDGNANGGNAGAAGVPKPGQPGNGGQQAAKNDTNKEKPEKVERWEMRPEVIQKVAEVGTNSVDSLTKAARDPDKTNDPTVMGNVLFYYRAASDAVDSMWRSTVANLGQSRGFNGIRDKGVGQSIQMSEEIKDCDNWAQKVTAKIAKQDPEAAKNRQESIQKMVAQCRQMNQTNYRRINPRFERPDKAAKGDKGGDEEQLVDKGPDKEEARERDWRVSLSTWAKAGTTANDVTSNWQYTQKDTKAKVVTSFDKNGNVAGTEDLTVAEQLERYNQQLRDASKSYEEVQKRMGRTNSDPKKILSFQKQVGKEYLGDVMKVGQGAMMEDVEAANTKKVEQEESYQQLLAKPKR